MSRTLSKPEEVSPEDWRATMPSVKLPPHITVQPVTDEAVKEVILYRTHMTYECRMLAEMGISYRLTPQYIRQREKDVEQRYAEINAEHGSELMTCTYSWQTMCKIETVYAEAYAMMFKPNASIVALKLHKPIIQYTTNRKGNPKKITQKGFASRWSKYRNLVGHGRAPLTGVWGVAGNNRSNFEKDMCGASKLNLLAFGAWQRPEVWKEHYNKAYEAVKNAQKIEQAERLLREAGASV